MRPAPLFLHLLATTCLSAGAMSSQAAEGKYYDPSNAASPTGKTTGYTLYRTIGCPARELIGTPCYVPKPIAGPAPITPPMPLPSPAEVALAAPVEPAPARVSAPLRTAQYCAILELQFEIDQDEIQREYKEKLAALANFMLRYPDTTASIEGHTDDVGSDADNLALSQRRADRIVNHLVQHHGIAPARLSAFGHGESRPIADNGSEEGKRRNRRIEAVIACVTDIEGLAVKAARVTMALQMAFDRDQAEIKPEYVDSLGKVANFLTAHPDVTATVEGHTGNLHGTHEMNMAVSRQRARNVVNYLIDYYGIARSRLSAEGFGEERRFAYNTSQEGRQENRRVNIIFNYPE